MSTADWAEIPGSQVRHIRGARGDASGSGRWDDARALSSEKAPTDEYPDVLTVPAHERMP